MAPPMAVVGLFVDGALALPDGILICWAWALGSGLLVLFTIPGVVWETFVAIYCASKGIRPSPDLRPPTQAG